MTDEDTMRAAIAGATDAAERALCAASELSAIAGKMQPHNSSQSVVALNGSSLLGALLIVVGVIACVISVAGLMIVQMRIDMQAREIQQLRDKVEVHEVYINTSFRKEKQ